MRIYLAAPLFTQAERLWNINLVYELMDLLPDVFFSIPQIDAESFINDGVIDFSGMVCKFIENIEDSEIVIAILDGSDSDSGTSFECGYAYAKGKIIIGVRTDFRGIEDGGLNGMLNRTCSTVIYQSSIDQDIRKLAQTIANYIESIYHTL